jgi:cyclophilin family peptidyl-prolyl cis-trans isomerase
MPRLLCAVLVLLAWVTSPALAQAPAPPPAQAPPSAPAQPKAAPAKPPAAAKAATAVITMEPAGEVRLEFWPADAPNHVKNFLDLAAKGFYDGQRVHRVEPNFVVQFGDPQTKTVPLSDPKIGSGGPGYKIKAEFNKRPFERGVLGMARTDDPDSAGSQVYIMLGAAPFLNGKYTAFGRVTSGMEVVDKIKVGDRIKSIKVVR